MHFQIPHNSPPLRTIVVATDCSPTARRAQEWATTLATMHQARIVLVHAFQPSLLGGAPELDHMVEDAANMKLQEAARSTIQAGVPTSTECHAGKPWQVIQDCAQTAHADLIVIGTCGMSALDRLFIGSTADRVIRTATLPVLTVHPGDARPAFRHVLFATDFSETANAALIAALHMLQSADRRVHVTIIHASAPPHVLGDVDVPLTLMPDWNAIDESTRAHLESLADSIRSDQVDVATDVVRGYPVQVILEEAQSRHVDMIAIGSRGAAGIDRFLLGSTSERVLHHAHCPVLTTHMPVHTGQMPDHELRGRIRAGAPATASASR